MFADVLLPLPLEPTFTYSVPEHMRDSVKTGMRVIVQFGKTKYYTGIITGLKETFDADFEIKPVAALLDQGQIVRNPQLKLWEWISQYYMCSTGDVMRAALPSGLKVESETVVEINPDCDVKASYRDLDMLELFIFTHILHNGPQSLLQIQEGTKTRNVVGVINSLFIKGYAVISENLIQRYKPKKEQYICLTFDHRDKSAVHRAFKLTSRSEQQEKQLVALVSLTQHFAPNEANTEMPRKLVEETSGIASGVTRVLEKKGLVKIYDKEISRFKKVEKTEAGPPDLSQTQTKALRDICTQFKEKRVVLLHGVTGSGKTEIYMHLAQTALENGKQVLMLVPEIALTTQLTTRMQRVFGDLVVVYHSRFTDAQRCEIWHNMLNNPKPCIIIGARSAVFLPYSDLGLVIIDEEHDPSYKQFDPAPRYNARDTAIVLANMHGAKVLLGSATPSVETYFKAQGGKYGLVSLSERFTGVPMPSLDIIDMGELGYRKSDNLISRPLQKIAEQNLEEGRQAIFFQNRRGYAPVSHCSHCGYVPKCKNCDVSLTFHKYLNKLQCHYCGAEYPAPHCCPQCDEPDMAMLGYGTERIEEDIAAALPKARLLRMDLDSTRNKDSHANIVDDFSQQKADILIGTQMVTKGLDFDNVSLVAILDADAIINYPDFRATERAFNIIEQVGGRAGRKNNPGHVVVQTRNPQNPIIKNAVSHDYKAYYKHELSERHKFFYPPFSRIIYIYLRHRDEKMLEATVAEYGTQLRQLLGNRVFGPQTPPVSRIQNQYIRRYMLKVEPNASIPRIKQVLRELYKVMHKMTVMHGISIHYDVDPA